MYPHQPGAYKHEGTNFHKTQFVEQDPGTEKYHERLEQPDASPEGHALAPDVFDAPVNVIGPDARARRVYPHQPGVYKHEDPNFHNKQFIKQEPGTEIYHERPEQPDAYLKGHAIGPDVYDAHYAARDPEDYRQPRTRGRDFPYILLYIPLIYN